MEPCPEEEEAFQQIEIHHRDGDPGGGGGAVGAVVNGDSESMRGERCRKKKKHSVEHVKKLERRGAVQIEKNNGNVQALHSNTSDVVAAQPKA